MPTPAKMRKPLPPNLTIAEMLSRKTFEQLLEDRDIYTPADAAPLMDYHRNYIHQLCREDRIEHIERRGAYYLYARTVHGSVKHVAPSAKKPKRG